MRDDRGKLMTLDLTYGQKVKLVANHIHENHQIKVVLLFQATKIDYCHLGSGTDDEGFQN